MIDIEIWIRLIRERIAGTVVDVVVWERPGSVNCWVRISGDILRGSWCGSMARGRNMNGKLSRKVGGNIGHGDRRGRRGKRKVLMALRGKGRGTTIA